MWYKPSKKQFEALCNMWKFFWLHSDDIQNDFIDKDELDSYFKSFQERIEHKIKSDKKKKNFQKAVELWKVDLKEVQKKKEERILKYYSDPKILKEKWLEYHFKYQTSKKQLKDWMLRKTNNNIELVDEVLNNTIINEAIILEYRIQSLLNSWKKEFEIKSKLVYEKWFEEKVVASILAELLENFKLSEEKVRIKILNFCRKWKSKDDIRFELKDYKIDSNDLNEYLDKYYEDTLVLNKLKREISSLKNRWKNNQEIISQCLNKRYSYKDIQKFL